MPVPVGRGEVQALLEEGAWLLDVSDDEELDGARLPDAVHIPMTDLRRHKVAHFDPHWPVVVYGADLSCDRAPRAARLLEQLGFSCVYTYEGGKRDWMAFGLPVSGTGPLLASHLMQDCTCLGVDQPVFLALEHLDAAHADHAAVVGAGDIVLGAVSRALLTEADPNAALLDVMTLDPPTARPNDPAATMARALDGRGGSHVLVTTSSGRLLGTVTRKRLLGSGRTLAGLAVPA